MGSIPDHLLYEDRRVVYINMYRKIYTVVNGLVVGQESSRRNTGGKGSGKRHVRHLWEWAQSVRTCASQADNHLRALTMEEALNNQGDDGGVSLSLGSHLGSDTVQPRQTGRLRMVPRASAPTQKVGLFLPL